MEVGEDRISDGVVVRERELELSFRRFEDVSWCVLRINPSVAAPGRIEETNFVGELGLTSPSHHSQQFEQNLHDTNFAQKRREASDEIVEISSRNRSNPTVLMSALKQNLSNFSVDGIVDRVSGDEVAESSDEGGVDLDIPSVNRETSKGRTNLVGDRSENSKQRSRIDTLVVEVRQNSRRSTSFSSERFDS